MPSQGNARSDRGVLLWLGWIAAVCFAIALALSWSYFLRLSIARTPPPPEAAIRPMNTAKPVSPLLVEHQLDVPGRGEVFPALIAGTAKDYWPLAILTISNKSDSPVFEVLNYELPGWSRASEQTLVLGPRETRSLMLTPELLPQAFANDEMRQITLAVTVRDPQNGLRFRQEKSVQLHSSSDLYWGKSFANAQFAARWVTPHDEAVLKLVSDSQRFVPGGRMAGYNNPKTPAQLPVQVETQGRAVFQALQRSSIGYVSSIFTFGGYTNLAQRIRMPRETLQLRSANCIDVSVAFASAMEAIGMQPVLLIVPGHAFVGVRLGPQSQNILYLDLTVLPHGSFTEAKSRAQVWLKKTPPEQLLTVDVAAARLLGIYPLPTATPRTATVASD
jgi:hypothetical protein